MKTRGFMTAVVLLLLIVSCSGGNSPTTPEISEALTPDTHTARYQSQTQLLGYYDLTFDLESGSVEAIPNRSLGFTANAVLFLNNDPTTLTFYFQEITQGDDYVDIDLDVYITHPFPGQQKYDAYDVRGVFIGNGSGTLKHNSDLRYPVPGTDQILLNADGYTRWFNPGEFGEPGLFGYTHGNLAPAGYEGTATLNPYKYFVPGKLGPSDNAVWKYMTGDWPPVKGCFINGETGGRTYLIRLPVPDPGIKYGYAVLANWAGGTPLDHPAYATEAVAFKVNDNSALYYVDETDSGGHLILDIGVYDWSSQLSAGVMEDYSIILESTVLSAPYTLSESDLTPTDGGDHYSIYHVEVPADYVSSVFDNECWVIVEYPDYDYTNPLGVPNDAANDPLTAYFRSEVKVLDSSEECGWAHTWGGPLSDYAHEVAVDKDGDIYVAGRLNLDMAYSGRAYLKKFRPTGQMQWSVAWGEGANHCVGEGVAVDADKNVYVSGYFGGETDFDPGPGTDLHDSIIYRAAFLTSFDSDGNHQWARTWGDTSDALHGQNYGRAVGVGDLGYVFVTGEFEGESADLDPTDGIELHNWSDGKTYVSKFDSAGNFYWARNWGTHNSHGVAGDGYGNVYVVGSFCEDNVDFDPGPGVDMHSATPGMFHDVFLSKFDSNGDYQWANIWGGIWHEAGRGVVTDGIKNVFVAGYFANEVDFDPGPGTHLITSKGTDAFLISFDLLTGNFNWVRVWGGSKADSSRGLAINGSGNLYVTGHFKSEDADFDPGPGTDLHCTVYLDDAYVSCFDSLGYFQWARTWGGLSGQQGWGVAASDSGRVYVAGKFGGHDLEFAPVDAPCFAESDLHSGNGSNDSFLVKFMPDGCW